MESPEIVRHPDPAVYALALALASDALKRQADRLDELRGRTSNLLGAASISTAFLGSQAIDNHRAFAGWTYTAIIFFTLAMAAGLVVMLPYSGWRFTVDASEFIGNYAEDAEKTSLPELQRELALNLQKDYVNNDHRMKWLYRSTVVAGASVLLQVMAWLFDLRGRP